MSKRSLIRFHGAILAVALGLIATPSVFAGANIVIQNNDGAGVGFNDNTPAAPVGGNNGTTVGQQRLIAFQFAASVWGATLDSVPTITIQASWAALPCTANSGTLGSAGTVSIFRNFPNAPFPNTWYGGALANKLAGSDLSNGNAEISAQFNLSVGGPTCLTASPWYYGLDNNHGAGVDLVTVLLHEFSHGLGFQTFTNSSTGVQNGGFPSIFDRFLLDNTTGKTWAQMIDSERAASAIAVNHLVWSGPFVVADVPSVLSATPTLRINSPPGIAGNKQIGTAEFGPPLSFPGITTTVSGTSPADGCTAISTNLSGKIAFIDRGTCNFTVKVKNAQNVGALAVIIGNVASSVNPDIPPGLGGTDPTITIPSVGIAQTDANAIRGQLANNINASLFADISTFAGADAGNRVLMFTPNPFQSGSSVSHYDTTAFRNLLMEPNISDDLTHSVTSPQDLTFDLMRDIGWVSAAASNLQFSASNYPVNEAAGSVTITVQRTGDTSGTASVAYSTADLDNFTVGCGAVTGNAFARCDFATSVDTLTFAPGETTKAFQIPIINDSLAEGPETFQVVLSNPTGANLVSPSTATVTITDDDGVTGPNPIFTTPFFVRQQYLDFLSREPEVGEPWSAVLNGCSDVNNNPACDRVTVSGAFFGSPEFQLKGYFVYRFYKVALNRLPLYTEIVVDMRAVTGQTPADVFAKKAAFTNAFVQRPDFVAALGALPNDQYVNTLMGRYTLTQITTPDPANPDGTTKVTLSSTDLINRLNGVGGTLTRAQVLRAIADSDQVVNLEFNQAFVAMQYFGYLRRNPDPTGFQSWLTFLNGHPNDSRTMVNGFVNSAEYRLRFGPNP